MTRYLIVFGTLILIIACGKKNSSGAEAKLLRLNNQYDSALIKNDLDALNRLYADDFVYTNPEGKVLNKTEQIANIKASEVRLEQGQSTDVKVKIYGGDMAVMTGNFVAKGNYRGNPVNINELYTATWIKKDTSWQLVAEHSNVVK